MLMTWIDWTIVIGILAIMIGMVLLSKTYMRSVADFLAAGRTAGRYIISVAIGLAGLGAITIVGNFEMNYVAGFPMTWWGFTMAPVMVLVQVSGWVVYRFRQTRALTMAQFFEMRYSRRFRIFAGFLSYFSGIINFGIFPAVGARFFIYFCGLPQQFTLLGLTVSTFPVIMAALLAISLFFVFAGGQVAVILTDFIQGVFVNLIFVIIIIFIFKYFTWDQISSALQQAPAGESLINPFDTTNVSGFNLEYFLIGIFGNMYVVLVWQGTAGYNSCAKSAHEAKMAGVLSNWRGIPQVMCILLLPVCAYTILHHPDFSASAAHIGGILDSVKSEALQNQLRVPLAIQTFLPRGLFGAFVAVMLTAFISTHDSYLHSWGSIFIQDIVAPFRKKPLNPEQRLKFLRYSISGVAVFIFLFSLFYKQSQYINMFFAVTAAIFAGGAGSVIIGGLYWKRGTTQAAYTALITGSLVSIIGIMIHQFYPGFFINGQRFYALSMGSAIGSYVLVSLLGPRSETNMDKLLHRGKYEIRQEGETRYAEPVRGWKILGMGKEFTPGDKVIYILTYCWTALWLIIFIAGTVLYFSNGLENQAWLDFWEIYIYVGLAVSIIVTVWFAVGGTKDVLYMLNKLKTMIRNDKDDGSVIEDYQTTGTE